MYRCFILILFLFRIIFQVKFSNSENISPENINSVKLNFKLEVEKNVAFLLYTRYSKNHQILLYGNKHSIYKSHLNITKKTKVLIHGWFNSGDNFFAEQLREAYLKKHDYNIISVDWSRYSYNFYTLSRLSVYPVARMLDFLVELGVDPKNVHILGHSLGAHVAGIAGEHTNYNLSRITGLDPAGPLFVGNINRLDDTDADFVDIIHTSIYYLGIYKPTGHVDFYPNGGGPWQPGCGVCTHRRSYMYYIESIFNEKAFMAAKCEDWKAFIANNCSEFAFMGEIVDHSIRGKYYLKTGIVEPFGLGNITKRTSEKQ